MAANDPRPAVLPPIDHALAAATLRQFPSTWGVVAVVEQGLHLRLAHLASAIRRGGVAAYRPGGWFEAEVRRRHGYSYLYVRYVGDGADVEREGCRSDG